MARHVLVAIDGSDPSWAALEHALDVFDGERLTLLTVVDPMEGLYTGVDGAYYDPRAHEEAMGTGEALCEEARERAEKTAGSDETAVETDVVTGRPAQVIVEYAEEHDVDHVVVGSHGRTGVSRVLLGSVAERVVRRAPVPVTVVR